MTKEYLSISMQETLKELIQYEYLEGSYDDRTLKALERRGLARWYPYGAGGKGCWKITPTGKARCKEIAEQANDQK